MDMQVAQVQAHARRLYEMMGPVAIADAAQKALLHARNGRTEDALLWRRIEQALLDIRGPRVS